MRIAEISRKTRETNIEMKINLDGSGQVAIQSPIGFLTHMLETLARHGAFDLEARIEGDLEVDQHHTVEDTGIVLGEVFKKALGDKKGIRRAGFFIFPMDEALARVALDISGRPFLKFKAKFEEPRIGDLESGLIEDFFLGFTNSLGANVHVKVHYGRSDHHKAEAIFKALGRALRTACEIDPRMSDEIPSTKGVI
ncbi:MAG: imidazoleglycerol-phosphate dehydratase HisB [Calditrichaeota bacterium]|nr:MAG: imidazoleglycerol-phosphate dehydratase HisB [Calditrichota bacterium]